MVPAAEEVAAVNAVTEPQTLSGVDVLAAMDPLVNPAAPVVPVRQKLPLTVGVTPLKVVLGLMANVWPLMVIEPAAVAVAAVNAVTVPQTLTFGAAVATIEKVVSCPPAFAVPVRQTLRPVPTLPP